MRVLGALLLAGWTALVCGAAELRVETRAVAPGSRAVLALFGTGLEPAGLLTLEVEYDWGALTLAAVHPAADLRGADSSLAVAMYPETLPDAGGRLRFAVVAAGGVPVAGRLADLVFDVGDSVASLEPVRLVAAAAADTGGRALPVQTVDGGFQAITAVADAERPLPAAAALLPNFPNPFNPVTTIPFQLPASSAVELRIFNMMGQVVRVLDLGVLGPGYYDGAHSMATWDGCDQAGRPAASGVYLIRLQAGDFAAVRKSLLLR